MGRPGFVTNEHTAFALGVARKALETATETAIGKIRGYNTSNLLAHRPVYQRALGEADLKLRAARALNVEVLEEAWTSVNEGQTPGPALQARLRAVAAYATDVANEVVSTCFRYGGGEALFQSSVLQRCLRDINAAAQHQMVSEHRLRKSWPVSAGVGRRPGAGIAAEAARGYPRWRGSMYSFGLSRSPMPMLATARARPRGTNKPAA